jgi:hypothetical protein
MHTITVTIDPSGASTVEVNGVQGPNCKELTAKLEQALGATIGSVPKAEFYEAAQQQNQAYQ